MSSHTPEQWHAEYFEFLRIWDVTRGPVDDGSQRFSVLEELTEQDARLIAAAPEMLEALKMCVETLNDYCGGGEAMSAAVKAMNKATGEELWREMDGYFERKEENQ